MNCKECVSIVEEYVEDGLDARASEQTAAHIFACGSCRRIYEELKNEQEILSRYLLKIKEKPKSWDAVRTQIRIASSVAAANEATAGAGFYERFVGVFFRRPLIAAMAVLVLIVGVGFGLYRNYVRQEAPVSGVISKEPSSSEQKSRDIQSTKNATTAGDESPVSNNNEGNQTLTAGSVRPGIEKKRAKSTNRGVVATNNSAASFDSSEAAFNRLIEKCEMVLRSFRNAVPETGGSRFDVSYERRLAKELLNNSVKFRREAQSEGNLPVETLLADLEAILGDITKLPKRPTSSDANLIRARIQESGIIAKLQVQSSIAGTSE